MFYLNFFSFVLNLILIELKINSTFSKNIHSKKVFSHIILEKT